LAPDLPMMKAALRGDTSRRTTTVPP
jgi:hypothetical protein